MNIEYIIYIGKTIDLAEKPNADTRKDFKPLRTLPQGTSISDVPEGYVWCGAGMAYVHVEDYHRMSEQALHVTD